ncbi:hypothetical protein P7K49_019691 [Saguinus oedipus]|uniref:Uncharacterized protein n=1 Tax=Saguinus oedipus TaxID=9490 RepID=A0ABQ9UZ11_SAGOE|nr:hypothetical protein P7K49_019691 [Saguinus oedipus]
MLADSTAATCWAPGGAGPIRPGPDGLWPGVHATPYVGPQKSGGNCGRSDGAAARLQRGRRQKWKGGLRGLFPGWKPPPPPIQIPGRGRAGAGSGGGNGRRQCNFTQPLWLGFLGWVAQT